MTYGYSGLVKKSDRCSCSKYWGGVCSPPENPQRVFAHQVSLFWFHQVPCHRGHMLWTAYSELSQGPNTASCYYVVAVFSAQFPEPTHTQTTLVHHSLNSIPTTPPFAWDLINILNLRRNMAPLKLHSHVLNALLENSNCKFTPSSHIVPSHKDRRTSSPSRKNSPSPRKPKKSFTAPTDFSSPVKLSATSVAAKLLGLEKSGSQWTSDFAKSLGVRMELAKFELFFDEAKQDGTWYSPPVVWLMLMCWQNHP